MKFFGDIMGDWNRSQKLPMEENNDSSIQGVSQKFSFGSAFFMGSGPISNAQVPSMKMCTDPEKISQKIMALSTPDNPCFFLASRVALGMNDKWQWRRHHRQFHATNVSYCTTFSWPHGFSWLLDFRIPKGIQSGQMESWPGAAACRFCFWAKICIGDRSRWLWKYCGSLYFGRKRYGQILNFWTSFHWITYWN